MSASAPCPLAWHWPPAPRYSRWRAGASLTIGCSRFTHRYRSTPRTERLRSWLASRRCSNLRSAATLSSGIRSMTCTSMATTAAESHRDAAAQQRAALAELRQAFGPGGASATAWAPGRCTLVGDHVDYAGGMVLCAAIGRGVAVALRPSADGAFRVISAGRMVERVRPDPVGDIGDRIFACVTALRDAGVDLPPVEVGVSATLPESVGLASSAAITCAVITALLRLASASMPMREVIATALRAEREIVGVPCGPLDPTSIIAAPAGGALLR